MERKVALRGVLAGQLGVRLRTGCRIRRGMICGLPAANQQRCFPASAYSWIPFRCSSHPDLQVRHRLLRCRAGRAAGPPGPAGTSAAAGQGGFALGRRRVVRPHRSGGGAGCGADASPNHTAGWASSSPTPGWPCGSPASPAAGATTRPPPTPPPSPRPWTCTAPPDGHPPAPRRGAPLPDPLQVLGIRLGPCQTT